VVPVVAAVVAAFVVTVMLVGFAIVPTTVDKFVIMHMLTSVFWLMSKCKYRFIRNKGKIVLRNNGMRADSRPCKRKGGTADNTS
jgi:hypothetical protein